MTVARAMAQNSEAEVLLSSCLFYDADIEVQPGKTRKTKRQRRQEKFQFGVAQVQENVCPFEIPQDMGLWQQQDTETGSFISAGSGRAAQW